jgi:hypothetical protein
MKNLLTFMGALVMAPNLAGCSDDNAPAASGNGEITLEFDQAYGANDLIFNVPQSANSQGEVLKINAVKYIVSNIVLTKTDGTTVTYPKSESYFIVDESDAVQHNITLHGIPAGDYTKVRFGIGMDQAQYDLGADGQGDFLALAQAEDMLWSWSAGYKFLAFEGTFTSPTVTADTPFMVHTGKTGTDYNYTEVTLEFPSAALVRESISPIVHIVADVSEILDGTNAINLSAQNTNGMGAMIMGGETLPLVTANLSGVFSVNHVHNDENAHAD